jgi:outer membrane lipase/esterase
VDRAMQDSGVMMKPMGKWTTRAFAGLAVGLMLALLSSCGGGTEQIEPFEPRRYLAFGDEMNVLTKEVPQGRKYTVNALNSDGNGIDCAASGSSSPSQLWVQILANTFNFAFEECNPVPRPVTAFSYAAPGAKAADFVLQLAEARVVHGAFGCNDLMSVLVGANDVIDLYENVYLADPTSSTANAVTNELSARGRRLGLAITELTANNGPNIIVSTIPLMNLTPYARQQAVDRPNVNAPNVLSQFSNAFNTALRTNIPNDGSRWGLVELDAMVNAAVNSPDSYGLTNVVNAVCDQLTWNTPDCTTNTLVANGNANTWLWASDRWIGWQAHSRLGSFARTRARDNPFGCV